MVLPPMTVLTMPPKQASPMTMKSPAASSTYEARSESAVRRFAGVFLDEMLQASMPKVFGSVPGASSYQDLYMQSMANQIATVGNGMGLVPLLDKALHLPVQQAMPTLEVSTNAPMGRVSAGAPLPEALAANAKTFIHKILPYAEQIGQALGIAPRLIVAQAALETGWGQHVLGNNLFGIKALPGQPHLLSSTTEYLHGVEQHVQAFFRNFPSVGACMQHYADLIKQHYPGVIGVGGNAQQFGVQLQAGGYATDPNYGAKLAATADNPLLLAISGEP